MESRYSSRCLERHACGYCGIIKYCTPFGLYRDITIHLAEVGFVMVTPEMAASCFPKGNSRQQTERNQECLKMKIIAEEQRL